MTRSPDVELLDAWIESKGMLKLEDDVLNILSQFKKNNNRLITVILTTHKKNVK